MPWERDYEFNQMHLAVWRGTERHDTFCTALVIGWLTEEPNKPFRTMARDQLEGRNSDVTRLHRAQVALREAGREVGLPILLNRNGLISHGSIKSSWDPTKEGRLFNGSELAEKVQRLRATKVLIEVESRFKGSHALGVRLKPARLEFFDPNHGMYSGAASEFGEFLQSYLRDNLRDHRYKYEVTSLVNN